MKKYVKLGVALLLVTCLIVTGITFHTRNTFVNTSNIICSASNDTVAKLLTEKTGIVFNENIALHKELIRNYDNIVFYEMTDVIKRKNKQDETIACYIKRKSTEIAVINFILIDGLTKAKGNYIIAYQIEWKNQSTIFLPRLTLENMLWDIDNEKNNYLLCCYEKNVCWLEKKLTPASVMHVDYYPNKINLGKEAKNTMIQIWGSIIPTEDYSNNKKLVQIKLNLCSKISKKEKLEYIVEWWDTDSILE